jgi:hypothetical protein
MSAQMESVTRWLNRGFAILPCQPGTKSLMSGFGLYRSKISDIETALQWWKQNSKVNMAVIAPEDFFILDFDSVDVYAQWTKEYPSAARSYTETTPRGGTHVFMRGKAPAGVTLKTGAELKRIVLVFPSVVQGLSYKCVSGSGEILAVDPVACLSSLSIQAPGKATNNFLRADQARRSSVNPFSHIEQIKQHYTISRVLSMYHPELVVSGRGDFKSCACPFHEDKKPSFWFNDQSGLFGCHACKVRGDVINLYAKFEGVKVGEAITRMWAVMS